MPYATADNQFLVLWNRQSISSGLSAEFKTPTGATYIVAPGDTEIAESMCYSKALGVTIGSTPIEEIKKSRWHFKTASLQAAHGKCSSSIRHLFLFGHSTWRTRSVGGASERGLSVQTHFVGAADVAQLINNLTSNCHSALAIWLLTCYGASTDLATDTDDYNGALDTAFGSQLVKALTNPATMIFAFDKAVTKKTLDICRTAALSFPNPLDLFSGIETKTVDTPAGPVLVKTLLASEAKLVTFKK